MESGVCLKLDVQGQGGGLILDIDGQGGVGGLDNWTIFMGIIHVSSLKITHVYVFNNLIIKW